MEVSVVIPAYNAAPFIGRALESVQAQTAGSWEAIVVDDASTDETAALVSAMAERDARIRLLASPTNEGPAAARNRAIAASAGRWIAVLDADDAWTPDRLETLLAAAQGGDWDFVADNQIRFDRAAERQSGVMFPAGRGERRLDLRSLLESEHPRSKARYGYLKPLIRKAALDRLDLRYRPQHRLAEDFLLYAELLLKGARCLVIDTAHYIYTTQRGDLSWVDSDTSRTVFVAQGRVELAAYLRAAYGPDLDGDRAFRRYQRWMFEAAHRQNMSQLRWSGRLGALAATMIRHPWASLTWLDEKWRRTRRARAVTRRQAHGR